MAEINASDGRVVLEASGVWKLFGVDAQNLELAGPLDPARVEASRVVVGIRDASLSIRKGEVFVLMGLSDSGKSTLLRCLAGLVPPSFGRITLEGINLAKADRSALVAIRREQVGMVFQSFALLPHLTALENVAFPLRVRGLPRRERDETAHRLLALVGLEGRADFFPHQLSGGQQQRVGIARSLVGDPSIWFLDEPFSALDPLIRRDMQVELLRLQSTLRKTIVFVTHDFDEAARIADRIAIMRDGVIVQTGTAEELVTRPANEYVRSFTAGVHKIDVVRVSSVLEPKSSEARLDEPVSCEATLASVAARLIVAEKPLSVAGIDGRIVGSIWRRTLAQWL